MEPISTVSIESNASRYLVARVNDSGELQLAGHETLESQDIGDGETRYAGDIDYTLTVAAAYRDTVLLRLLEEHFESESEFAAWLQKKGIPSHIRN
jgi:hypothetical protein